MKKKAKPMCDVRMLTVGDVSAMKQNEMLDYLLEYAHELADADNRITQLKAECYVLQGEKRLFQRMVLAAASDT